jgi:hypothetical protein
MAGAVERRILARLRRVLGEVERQLRRGEAGLRVVAFLLALLFGRIARTWSW